MNIFQFTGTLISEYFPYYACSFLWAHGGYSKLCISLFSLSTRLHLTLDCLLSTLYTGPPPPPHCLSRSPILFKRSGAAIQTIPLITPSLISWYLPHYQDLQCLSEWLEDNNLVLNVSKTTCVLFTFQRHKGRDCNLNPNLLGKSISCETTFKYLGVMFDNFMTWKAHADYVCVKVASRVSILGRVRSFVKKETATVWLCLQ